MRITNQMLQQTALRHVQGNMRRMTEAQEQVASGRRLHNPSDDPIAASGAMRARSSLRALEQYRQGGKTAEGRGVAEERVLNQLTDLLSRARELATAQASDTATEQSRRVVRMEVDGLLQQAISLGNTRAPDGSYLFGGDQSGSQPFSAAEGTGYTSTNPTGRHSIRVSEQRYVVANHNGTEVFQDTGVLESLQQLSEALGSNDREAIAAAGDRTVAAFDAVQVLFGELGTRMQELQTTSTRLDTLEVDLEKTRSDLEEVEIEEAMMELMGRQSALQAAMLATSRVMGLNLADYLR